MAAISAGTLLKEPRRSHLLVRSRRRPPPCSANTIRWARNEVGNAGERPARHRHWRAGGWKRCPRRCEGPSTWETHGRGAGGSSRTRIAVGTTRADLGAAGDRGSMSLGSTRSRVRSAISRCRVSPEHLFGYLQQADAFGRARESRTSGVKSFRPSSPISLPSITPGELWEPWWRSFARALTGRGL